MDTTELTSSFLEYIVIAEDDPQLNAYLVTYIHDIGLEVVSTFTGKETIEFVTRNPRSLIVLDYRLPDMSGKEVVHALKRLGVKAHFIITTGFGDEHIASTMMKLGAHDYLVKDETFITAFPIVLNQVIGQIETARKLAAIECELDSERDYFETILSNLPAFMYIQDKNGHITYANKTFVSLFGPYESKTCDEFFPDPDAASAACLFEAPFIAGAKKTFECSFKGRVHQVHATVFIDEHGVPHVLGVGFDITGEKKANRALAAEERRLRSLFDNMLHGLVHCSVSYDDQGNALDSRIIEVNRAFERIMGMKKKDVVGKQISDVMPEVLESEWFAMLGSVTSPKKSLKTEMYSPLLNRWFSIALFSPRKVHYITLFDDITEKKRTEEALRTSEERLKLVFAATNVGLWDWNIQNDEFHVNDHYYTMLGYEPHEFSTSFDVWNTLVNEDDKKRAITDINDHLAGKTDTYESIYRIKAKSGTWLWILSRGTVVSRAPDGAPLRFVGTHVDISERKKMEDDLRETLVRAEAANEAKSTFLANMSHELRTPLNGILGMSQILGDSYYGELNPKQASFVDTILKSGTLLLDLINDILDLSKVEAGKMTLDTEEFAPATVAAEIIGIVKHRAAEKELLITSTVDTGAIIANDRMKTRQILTNLIDNALKFTKAGGAITITSERRDGMFVIHVHDTGIGIPESEIGRLFEHFRQIDSSYTKKVKGTGLGLALSKKLANFMGGDITVASEFHNGSTFSLHLPL